MTFPSSEKMQIEGEMWREIPGYEGIYEASNLGRVRSMEGKTTHNCNLGILHWKSRIIKEHYITRKNGKHADARITLWKDKAPHYYLVSRIIAMTWCDGYQEGMTVNHIDGNPLNNSCSNLEWITLAENIRHGFRSGLYSSMQKPITIKINGEDVAFNSMSEASRALGRNNGYINRRIKNNRPLEFHVGE